ncbi:Ig-like domain-containing protein [Spongiibacter thalassae]|nr:Ig-like domain-containing protein [Spongiibacter thalassae]
MSVSSIDQLDQVTFAIIPVSPLDMDGDYTVSVGPDILSLQGQAMEAVYDGALTLDTTPPSAPSVANYAGFPAEHALSTNNVALTGTRDVGSSIYVNGAQYVAANDDTWSAEVPLQQGINDLAVTARDAVGNESTAVALRFEVDSIAPAIAGMSPANGTYTRTAPSVFAIDVVEIGSGLDLAGSSLSVLRNGGEVSGTWGLEGDQMIFQPNSALTDAIYQVIVTLQDQAGLRSSQGSTSFTLDQTPPDAPGINSVPDVVNTSTILLSGSKEAWASVWLNGSQWVPGTASTTWSKTVTLVEGDNALTLTQHDRASNESRAVVISVNYNNTAPGAVPMTIDPEGDGLSVQLDWSGYDEEANGNDIALYRVLRSTTAFTDPNAATIAAQLPAGIQNYSAAPLSRNQAYYFAVLAVDQVSNALASVTPTATAPVDVVAPENISGLVVTSGADSLSFVWQAPDDHDADLAGFRIYQNDTLLASHAPATTTYSLNSLAAASAHTLRITSVDNDDNESTGLSQTGVTWLPNPTGLSTEPLNAMVELSWQGAQPAQFIKHYAIYMADQPFTDISAMTPILTAGAGNSSIRVAGLTNDQTYYFAVATVNTSNGVDPVVMSVAGTPEADTEGPILSDFLYGSTSIGEGAVLARPAQFSVTATDKSGIGRVEFYINDILLATDANGSAHYRANWDIKAVDDGSYLLRVVAYDTLEYTRTLEYTVQVALAAPDIPALTAPVDGLETNLSSITVSGTAEPDSQAQVYNNGSASGNPVVVNSTGQFSALLSLVEGSNDIRVTASNRGGESGQSAARTVVLNSSLPPTPTGLLAQAREGGEVRLSWSPVTAQNFSHYNLYRHNADFDAVEHATRINSQPLTQASYSDLPPSDGRWVYRVVAVNDIGTVSAPSAQVSALADATAPTAVAIDYTPYGNVDPATGRIATGAVDVHVTVSEPLLTTPFLSITPTNGVPLPVQLQRVDDTHYSGSFEITPLTPGGTAYAVFSARDVLGNRGTEVESGATIQIDTDGPAVSELTVNPAHPIRNDESAPVTVAVTITLTEALQGGEQPALSYLLSGEGRSNTAMPDRVQLDDVRWRYNFTLPGDAGLDAPELLSFSFQAVDDLGNVGTTLPPSQSIQVYQGDLPPLEIPEGLSAVALPGGVVQLTWQAVPDAADYQLYRQAPGETGLTERVRTGDVTLYDDQTTVDGEYLYAIASVRSVNNQETLSALSDPVSVTALSVPPEAPTALNVELTPQGIAATWQHTGGEGVTYTLYRDSSNNIASVDGLIPVRDGIASLSTTDTSPAAQSPGYVVTAVDAAGNQSVPSNTAYLNISLLPISSVDVTLSEGGEPQLNWTHDGSNIDGFDLYLGDRDTGLKLNDALMTSMTYSDSGFNGGERVYTLVAVDPAGEESLPRSLLLPALSASLTEGSQILRGVMNRLTYQVANLGQTDATGIQVVATIGVYSAQSATFSLAAGESTSVDVVFGGAADLSNVSSLTTSIETKPNVGEHTTATRTGDIIVGDAGLVLSVATREFTRGATGEVQFTLENTSDVDIEIVVARNNGNSDSDEIRYQLRDLDGNVLSTQAFRQFVGNDVVTRSDGTVVAGIPAGESFTSDWKTLSVPAAAPAEITVRLYVDTLHYHLGRSDAVAIAGPSTSATLTLIDTLYYGSLSGITPANSFGEEPIVISGQALTRADNAPLSSVPLTLVIKGNGFERSIEVYTDEQGGFSHAFEPLKGESGVYTVSVIHPDIQDRPVQGTFAISRVSVSPSKASLYTAYGQHDTIPVTLRSGPGTTASNLRVELHPDTPLAAGVTLDIGQHLNLGQNSNGTIDLDFTADHTAESQGQFAVQVFSDESGDTPLASIPVTYLLDEALPSLYWYPNYVETGVAQDESVSANFTLENRGLAEMVNVRVRLVDTGGNAAPSWLYLAVPEQQGSLAVGEQRPLQIIASPPASLAEGQYQYKLRISSDNHPVREANVFVAVTQSGIGGALFKVSDIYTATLDGTGQVIEGLSGAKVRLINEEVAAVEFSLTTDASGEALFSEIPSGNYLYRISAPNHADGAGRLRVLPGVVASENFFLDYNLVTVEWSVNEVTIEDRYDITATATYETSVPAAVVIVEPLSINIPNLTVGEVYYGELRITNYGLIRADNLQVDLPPSDDFYRYELMVGLPDTIEANESLVVPYRIVMLQSHEPDGDATGGGCYNYTAKGEVSSDYTCANGDTADQELPMEWNRSDSSSCGSGGPGGGGGAGGGGGYWSAGGAGGSFGGGGGGGFLRDDKTGGIPACRAPKGDGASCPSPGNGAGS